MVLQYRLIIFLLRKTSIFSMLMVFPRSCQLIAYTHCSFGLLLTIIHELGKLASTCVLLPDPIFPLPPILFLPHTETTNLNFVFTTHLFLNVSFTTYMCP